MERYDDVIAGAGILGLAHAWQLARRGRRVLVIERRALAEGASIRNFGMLWPIGQPAGPLYQLARKSLDHWLNVLASAGLWHDRIGSLHLAYADDEAQVLREFANAPENAERACELWDATTVHARSPRVQTAGLKNALWSATETCVDPRQVIGSLPAWLTQTLGVRFQFGTAVVGFEAGSVRTSSGTIRAERLIVCTGEDFLSLFPEAYANTGLMRCKLQMMRSQPLPDRLGPMLAAGLTLLHYKNFAACPTLPALRERLERELPEYGRLGIHVLVSQNGLGELILGDSHEYGDAIEIFDKPAIDDLVLAYLRRFLPIPDLRIASRWHGFYAKHPSQAYLVVHPCPGATVVNAVGGAGMTLSFGLADQVVRQLLGETDAA